MEEDAHPQQQQQHADGDAAADVVVVTAAETTASTPPATATATEPAAAVARAGAGAGAGPDAASSLFRLKPLRSLATTEPGKDGGSIVLQNVNGPCPLLAAVNCLVLRGALELPAGARAAGFVDLDVREAAGRVTHRARPPPPPSRY